jgi:hypothetical protein
MSAARRKTTRQTQHATIDMLILCASALRAFFSSGAFYVVQDRFFSVTAFIAKPFGLSRGPQHSFTSH